MTPRALTSLVDGLTREFRTPRSVLRAVARAMLERREMPAPHTWGRLQTSDAPLESLLLRDDALGAVYQALRVPALERAFRENTRDGRKFEVGQIPEVTGLFTPRWVTDLLVRDTLSLRDRAPQAGRLNVKHVRVLDPACGTMNFGLAAIDVLREMYRGEIDRAGRPDAPAEPSVREERDIDASILRNNLFGIDIDPTALWLARLTLGMKLRIDARGANLKRADALFDDDDVGQGFDVVVTNPPYVSARNLPAGVVARLKKAYPLAWRDLYACFIDRCLRLCREGGRVGLLTMQSFMFTAAFEKLRMSITDRAAVESIVHIGPGLFPTGNPGTLQTVAFTLRSEPDPGKRASRSIAAIRLVDYPNESEKAQALREQTAPRFTLRQSELTSLPRGAWSYDAPPATRAAFSRLPKLRDAAPPRQGLATTDNARFVRYWWEVESTRTSAAVRATSGRWFPYAKSGRFRRWYEAPRHRVNWEDDGREIKEEIARRYPYLRGKWKWVAKNATWYGRPGGITYSYLTSGRFSARRLEVGSIFDVAGSSLFPLECPLATLAVLNSSVAKELLRVINPTLNFQVGDLAELPVPPDGNEALAALAAEAIELHRTLDTFDETSPDFRAPMAWGDAEEMVGEIYGKLDAVEREVDRVVAEIYAIQNEDPHPNPLPEYREREKSKRRAELARRWVSFALGRLLGRWGVDEPGAAVLRLRPAPAELVERIREELSNSAGAGAVEPIESSLGGIDRFVERDFYAWHVRLFSGRPAYWCFGDRRRAALLLHDDATAPNVADALRVIGARLPEGWTRCVDDGVVVNLAPLAPWVADAKLARTLAVVQSDLRAGRYQWSQTAAGLSRGSPGGSARLRCAAGPAVCCPAART